MVDEQGKSVYDEEREWRRKDGGHASPKACEAQGLQKGEQGC